MKILSLETSLKQGSVAGLLGDANRAEICSEMQLPADERSARSLLPTIDTVLQKCGWQPKDLDLICTTVGPGSFTGLRIGVTAAKTLAFTLDAAIVGVHTLAAIAANVPDFDSRLWAIMDAQRGELFAAEFSAGKLDYFPETRIVPADEWLAALKPGEVVVGPPLSQLREKLPKGVRAVGTEAWQPQASVVGRLGYQLFREGKTTNPIQLVPNYYRKSAAEEKAAMKTS